MQEIRLRPWCLAATFSAGLSMLSSRAEAQCTATDLALPTTSPWTSSEAFNRISQLDVVGKCLGGDNDPSKLSTAVKKSLMVPKPNETDPEAYPRAVKAGLILIAEYLTDTVTPASPDVLRDLTLQVRAVIATLGSGVAPALPTAWVVDASSKLPALPLPPPRTLKSDLDNACAVRNDTCVNAFETLKVIKRVAQLMNHALEISERRVFLDLLGENVKRGNSWDAYFEKARSQYPWELALNSKLMNDDRPEVAPGVKGGFRSVPTSQVLFLHPYVAMEYAAGEVDGNKFNSIALMDVIGLNKWSWNADGSMGRAVGASWIISAADHVNTKKVSHGFMVHLNHTISGGFVFSGGDKPTYIVSGDAAKLWTKASEATRKALMTGK